MYAIIEFQCNNYIVLRGRGCISITQDVKVSQLFSKLGSVTDEMIVINDDQDITQLICQYCTQKTLQGGEKLKFQGEGRDL